MWVVPLIGSEKRRSTGTVDWKWPCCITIGLIIILWLHPCRKCKNKMLLVASANDVKLDSDWFLNWIHSDQIRRNNKILLLSSWAQLDLITLNVFCLLFGVERRLRLINDWKKDVCLFLAVPLFDSFSPSIPVPLLFSTSLLSFLSVSQGWGRAALQLPSSEPGWHHRIAASSLGVPIHHPDHHRQHQQHHLRMHTHIYTSTHPYCMKIKEKRAPTGSAGLQASRKEGEGHREEEGRSCWGRQKPLTCALPTIHLNKPQYRQMWWVRLQATQGKQQHKKSRREKTPPLPPHRNFPRGEPHFLSLSHQLI